MKTILDVIKEKSIEVGDCLEWQGYCNGKTPCTSTGGVGIGVRKLVAIRLGMKVQGKLVTNRCGNNLCVKPEHLVLMFKSNFHSKMARTKIDHGSIQRRMKLSASARKRSKITAKIAAEIRDEPGTYKAVGIKFGVCAKTGQNIKHGETWRDYGMFGQLWTF